MRTCNVLKRLNLFASVSFVLALSISCTAFAYTAPDQASLINFKANYQGGQNKVTLTAADAAKSEVDFYYISQNNQTLFVDLSIGGPAGVEGSLEFKQLKGSVDLALSNPKGWMVSRLNRDLAIATSQYKVAAAAATTSALDIGAMDCSLFSKETLQTVIDTYAGYGVTLTEEDACNILKNNAGNGDNGGTNGNGETPGGTDPTNPYIHYGYSYARGAIYKDACDNKMKKYLVRLRVSLAKVDAAAFEKGFNISATIKQRGYGGSRATKLKDRSDGRDAPHPIILMRSLGGNQSITAYVWKNGTRTQIAYMPVTRFYGAYAIARVDPAIDAGRGRKATFEITNGYSIYGVCLVTKKVNQEINGYH